MPDMMESGAVVVIDPNDPSIIEAVEAGVCRHCGGARSCSVICPKCGRGQNCGHSPRCITVLMAGE